MNCALNVGSIESSSHYVCPFAGEIALVPHIILNDWCAGVLSTPSEVMINYINNNNLEKLNKYKEKSDNKFFEVLFLF